MTHTDDFEAFYRAAEPRPRRAYGVRLPPERVGDAVGTALEFAWAHWDRVLERSIDIDAVDSDRVRGAVAALTTDQAT